MGCGRYSDKLTYEQWYNFNNAQRVHLNFLEFAPTNFAILLIAGIYFPILSAAAGLAVIIARIMYSIGYVLKGPPGRMIGAFANDAAIILLFVLSIISSVYFIQGQQINGRLIQ